MGGQNIGGGGTWVGWKALDALFWQEWACTCCERGGSVGYEEDEVWIAIMGRIGLAHHRMSPDCSATHIKKFRGGKQEGCINKDGIVILVKEADQRKSSR